MKNTDMMNEIAIVDRKTVENLIYVIRGQKVMLDVDLAKIYGYETKNFNRQVKNNIGRFDTDFMFQLTRDELESLRCIFKGCGQKDYNHYRNPRYGCL